MLPAQLLLKKARMYGSENLARSLDSDPDNNDISLHQIRDPAARSHTISKVNRKRSEGSAARVRSRKRLLRNARGYEDNESDDEGVFAARSRSDKRARIINKDDHENEDNDAGEGEDEGDEDNNFAARLRSSKRTRHNKRTINEDEDEDDKETKESDSRPRQELSREIEKTPYGKPYNIIRRRF